LAEDLGIAQKMDPVASDAIALTTSNAAGNKIDSYLHRSVEYRVSLDPDVHGDAAHASAQLSATLENAAPSSGLPEAVIGPFDFRFHAGENRAYESVYTPLTFEKATVNGKEVAVSSARERGRNVYSRFADLASKAKETTDVTLGGTVALHDG